MLAEAAILALAAVVGMALGGAGIGTAVLLVLAFVVAWAARRRPRG